MNEKERREVAEIARKKRSTPGSGISDSKPKARQPKPSSVRQAASRQKSLKNLDRATEAIGLPPGRNRRPNNSEVLAKWAEAEGLPVSPEDLFDDIVGSMLSGLIHAPGKSIKLRSLWAALVMLAESVSGKLADKLRCQEGAYIARLTDKVDGWCAGLERALPDGVASVGIYEGINGELVVKAITNAGSIMPEDWLHLRPMICLPRQTWLRGRISDEDGVTLVNAEFRGFHPSTKGSLAKCLDLEFLLKVRKPLKGEPTD